MFGGMTPSAPTVAVRALTLFLLFCGLSLLYRFLRGWVDSAGRLISRVAERRFLAMAVVAGVAMGGRLLLLPLVPVPRPTLPDEFSHLLLSETLELGRITNPTPPHWQNIENLFIIYEPTYQSKYPLGQGALMAFGKLVFGHPWFGVWLATGAMCAAVCWMLQGWLGPVWGLLGGVIVALRIAWLSDWINTYMGGSLAALGGALTMGALIRIRGTPRAGTAVVFGLGIVLGIHTRPFESSMFCLVTMLLLGRRLRDLRVIVPIAGTIALGVALVGYHNWRVTGNPLMLPYQLARKAQGMPQNFYWQAPVPAPTLRFRRIAEWYEWQLGEQRKGATVRGYLTQLKRKLVVVVYNFYAGYYFLPGILFALIFWRDWRVRALAVTVVMMLAWSSSFMDMYEHYLAQLVCVFLALFLYGIIRMGRWRWQSQPIGAVAAASLVLSSMQGTAFGILGLLRAPESLEALRFRADLRGGIESDLRRAGGGHVVFVRSQKGRKSPAGWYYNGPDPEHSPIIWAQEIDPASDKAFLDYYRGRRVWAVNADAAVPRLEPYRPGP
jgi:hypothetical protein